MSNISVFKFEVNEIRFANGKPVANDVAKALGYSDLANTVRKRVDAEYKGVAPVATPGGIQSMVVLEEPGIYQLIFGSTLPSAKSFQKWLFEEVLPSIRKTGQYSTQQEPEVQKPQLPPSDIRVANLVSSMETYERICGKMNPYVQQQFKDLVGNLVSEANQNLLTASKEDWRGIVSFAEELGFKVPIKGDKCRTKLGKFVAAAAPELAQYKEKRLCNEVQQPIYVYPLHLAEVKNTLTKLVYCFFDQFPA